MYNRYKKHVIDANTNQNAFKANGTGGKFIPIEMNIFPSKDLLNLPSVLPGKYAKRISAYTDSCGNQAVIPPGWTVSKIENENTIWGKNVGLVIYRIPEKLIKTINWKKTDEIQSKFDQFVYVPVHLLDSDGTLDGKMFNEKFGRRNFSEVDFSERDYHEPLENELMYQISSVKKYGGFYISRYNISNVEGKARSIRNAAPWVYIDFNTAKSKANKFKNNELIRSHLVFGTEYDCVGAWFVKSGSKHLDNVKLDSSSWGNYRTSMNKNSQIAQTGSSDEWCVNNIYDLAGNVNEWTQERYSKSYCVIRGGSFKDAGFFFPAIYRDYEFPYDSNGGTGFRISLWIRP